jgi:beta-glucosidase
VTELLRFPPAFLFGTATAATQIEGGCTTSDWYAFAREPGRVRNGDTPDVACDGWNRWRDDVAIQRSLGMGACRMSIEWARIEPREGETDHGALDRYRQILGALGDASIEPLVTLHHFTLPLWLARAGGALAPEFPARFARFARLAAASLGDLCRFWVTTNEPNVMAAQGYLLGVWPPGRQNLSEALRAQYGLLEAHVAAYRALKEARGDARVGVAHHLRAATPAHPLSPLDRFAARTLDRTFNHAFALAIAEGNLFGPLDAVLPRRGFRVAEARGTQDFLGVNYYTRDVVRFSPARARELFIKREVAPDAEVSDLGWEIYPAGLGELLRVWARRTGLPIYVTENGVADARDDRRPRFITRHLGEIARALAEGVDVRGYFHWSLLDNFEWADGYEPRFGLVAVDYATQTRTPRPSAAEYARIARERSIPVDD